MKSGTGFDEFTVNSGKRVCPRQDAEIAATYRGRGYGLDYVLGNHPLRFLNLANNLS